MTKISKYNPFFKSDDSLMKGFFEDFDNTFFNTDMITPSDLSKPSYHHKEYDDYHYFELPLVGAKKEDVDIELKDNNLYIRVDNKHESERSKFWRSLNSFIRLPRDIDLDMIDVSLEDGLLKIKAQKFEKSQSKKLEIK